jgi:hypothetical protein
METRKGTERRLHPIRVNGTALLWESVFIRVHPWFK